MTIIKAGLWLFLLIPLMILLYNIPLSLLTSAYSKVRHGYVKQYARMPFILALVGMAATYGVGTGLTRLFDIDPTPLQYAVTLRAIGYLVFNY